MSDQIRAEAARDGVEPWFDAQDSMANHSLNVNRDGQAQYKYLMDIGGESGTTWLSLNWKMATGALVFKVDTGSINWWYVCAAFPSATLAANAYHVLFLPLLPPFFLGGGRGSSPATARISPLLPRTHVSGVSLFYRICTCIVGVSVARIPPAIPQK